MELHEGAELLATAEQKYAKDYATGENLRITVELKDLRPGSPWISEGDDFVVVAREKTASSISGSWRATARGNDKAFEGTVTLPIGKPHDVRSLLTLLDPPEAGDGS